MKNIFITTLLVLCVVTVKAQSIHQLAKDGEKEKILNLINNDPKLINSTDEIGYTPLHWSLIRAHWDLANFLINKGANLTIQGSEGGSVLHCAVNHNNVDIIKMLVKKGANIECKNIWGNTPLSLATARGSELAVITLIDLGANVNSSSNEGWTPLHYAYQSGHENIKQILINNGANESTIDNNGKTPRDYLFEKPLQIDFNSGLLSQYVGNYNVSHNEVIPITLNNGKLFMEDFAVDEIYPIGVDVFFHSKEPWKLRFYRNANFEVDRVVIEVQRNTIVGKKVKSKDDIFEKPRLGLKVRSINANDINDEVLKTLFFNHRANANAQIVTFVQENSVSFNSGIKENDIILEFNNIKLLESGDLFRLLYDIKPNSIVNIKVIRDAKVVYLNLKL